jgi:hypothetical protein
MTVRARAVGRVPPVDKRMTPEVYRLRTTTMERFGPGAFDGRRLGRPGKWVVDFSADWCPFCDQFLPIFAALEGNEEFQVAIGDLTDVDTPLWDLFDLEVTPTMIAFRDGDPVFRVDGRRNVGLTQKDVQAVRAAMAEPTQGTRPSGSPRR